MAEKEPSDSDWVRMQRLEESRKAWLSKKIKAFLAWVAGIFTTLWATFDAITKFLEWLKK